MEKPFFHSHCRSWGRLDWHWRIRRYRQSRSQGAAERMAIMVSAPMPAHTRVSKSRGIPETPLQRWKEIFFSTPYLRAFSRAEARGWGATSEAMTEAAIFFCSR